MNIAGCLGPDFAAAFAAETDVLTLTDSSVLSVRNYFICGTARPKSYRALEPVGR